MHTSAMTNETMSELIDDWKRYCQGTLEADKSHFLGLFKSEMTDVELQSALEFFPAAGELKERLNRVLSAGALERHLYLQRPPVTDCQSLLTAARAWLQEQEHFCASIGQFELQTIAREAKIVFSSDGEIERKRAEDNPNGWMFDHITDSVLMPLTGAPRIEYALREALYGIAADYYLAWYIAQPMLRVDIDFSKYFDFWKLGGDGVLTEDSFLICDRPGSAARD